MRLGKKQELFCRLLPRLFDYAHSLGYDLRMGRGRVSKAANEADGGHERSTHLYGLAMDLNLFRDGVFLTETSDHELLGVFWESLHPLCRWGGWWDDGNHYSLEHNGVK